MLLPDFCSSHTTDAEGHVLGADTEVDIFDPLVAADVCLTISAARQEAQLQAKAPDGVSLERISGAPGSSPIAPGRAFLFCVHGREVKDRRWRWTLFEVLADHVGTLLCTEHRGIDLQVIDPWHVDGLWHRVVIGGALRPGSAPS